MRCGLYKILGPGGRFYIGQSINIPERWHYHRTQLRRGTHGNAKLQNAWNKYGEKAFIFGVIDFYPAEDLDRYEQTWLDTTDAVSHGYNIVTVASSTRGLANPKVAERNRRTRGKDHPSFGKSRPDLAERNRTEPNPMKGKKLPETSLVKARSRLRGPLHFLYGTKREHPRHLCGPQKLREHIEAIQRRLRAGETVGALAHEFSVNPKTISKIKHFVIREDVKPDIATQCTGPAGQLEPLER